MKRRHKYFWNGKKVLYEHRVIWEKHFGKIPEGYVIHHINGNQEDNRIENLRLMTLEEHTIFHNKNKSQITKEKQSNSMKDYIKRVKPSHLLKKGHTPINKGKKGLFQFSPEQKEQISKRLKEIGHHPPSQKGKKQSSEHIRKRVESWKKRRKNAT